MTEWNSLSSAIRILKRNNVAEYSQLVAQHNKDTNAVTVIDDCPRDLLANHFTWNHTAAEVNRALDMARTEAQRLHGGFEKLPLLVTDNGLSFMAGRFQEHIRGLFQACAHCISYADPTGLAKTI